MSLNQFPRRSFVGSSTLQTFTGNGSITTFTLSSTQTQNECFVFVDDVIQVPGTDFTVNGTTLTFTSAPANSAEIIVRGFGVPAPVTTVSDGSVTAAKLATGAIEAKLGYTPVSPTQLSTEVANLVDAAPSTLNTLNELAAALGDDPNYATTITTALSTKANTSSLGTLASVSPTGTPDSTKFLRGDNSWQVVAVTPTAISDQDNTSTGYMMVPKGTTAQRPVSPSNGMVRYNTSNNELESYINSAWQGISNFPAGTYAVEYLVVAGGGSGGSGGGGAGGFLSGFTNLLASTAYTITVGAGGAGASAAAVGNQGANSSIASLVIAIGGGAGSGDAFLSGGVMNGGSGGGGGSYGSGNNPGGSGTAGQGNAGGAQGSGGSSGSGGGGGAGAVGGTGGGNAGSGGVGLTSSISGSQVYYAGGGGGSVRPYVGGSPGSGGTGGGGAGAATSNNAAGGNGSANSGGGGGGGSAYANTGGNNFGVSGNGGSGIVIIRYLGSQRGTGGTITSSGGYTIHTFTSSSTFTA